MLQLKSNIKLVIALSFVVVLGLAFGTTNVKAVETVEDGLFEGNTFIGIKIDDVILVEKGEVKNSLEGVNYNKETNTLTLTNYQGDYLRIGNMGKDFKIEIVGTNSFNNMGGAASGDYGEFNGFTYIFDSIIFTGNGTLNINNILNVGAGGLTVDGPTINVTGVVMNVGDLIIAKGSLNIELTEGSAGATYPIDCSSFECGENIECTDKEGKKLYLVTSEHGYKVFCYTETYSIDSVAKSVVIKEKEIKPITEVDNNTGVTINTTSDVVPVDTKLSVEKITVGTEYTTVQTALKDETTKMVVYDITLLSNNVEIQPNGNVKISLPIPSDYNKENLIVYRVEDNGTKTEYNVKVDGNYATFETDHFSTYVLAEKKVEDTNTKTEIETPTTNNDNKELDETPKTGVETNGTAIALAITSILSLVGVVTLKRF